MSVDDDGLGPVWRARDDATLTTAEQHAQQWLDHHPDAIVMCHVDLAFPSAERIAGGSEGRARLPVALVAHVVQRSQRLLHGLPTATASELAQNAAFARADAIIAPSAWAAAEVAALAPADANIVVAPPLRRPASAAKATAPPKATATPRQHGLHVVYAGRFDAIKGFDVLLSVLPALLNADPTLRVTLAGGLPRAPKNERRWAKRVAAALAAVVDGSERVAMPGFLDHDAALALLADADVVVVPSRVETFGLVAEEAMAAGRCVVAAAAGALGQRLNDGVDALVVEVGDAAALAKALRRALSDAPLRAALGIAARAEVAKRDADAVAGDRWCTTIRDLRISAPEVRAASPRPPLASKSSKE